MLPRYRFSPQDKFSPFIRELIKTNYITLDQANQLIKEVKYRKLPLLRVLDMMTGKTLSPELMRKYKKYRLLELKIIFGIDSFDVETQEINEEEIVELINSIIKIQVCRRYKLCPIKKINKPSVIDNREYNSTVLIAMVNPDNSDALDDIKKVLRMHDLGLEKCVITEQDHELLLKRYYEYNKSSETKNIANLTNSHQFDYNSKLHLETTRDEEEYEHLNTEIEGNDAPIIKLVNKILIKAIDENASAIYIEPQEKFIRIRFCINGILRTFFDNLPKHIISAITNRFKVIANLDISIKTSAQEGKFKRIFKGKTITFFTNIIAGTYGENIYLEIYDYQQIQLGLDYLIDNNNTLAQIKKLSLLSQGLIVFSGSSNITKSSLIYSFLSEKNKKDINIFSLVKLNQLNLAIISGFICSEMRHCLHNFLINS